MKQFSVTIKGLTPLLHHRMPEEDLMALLVGKKSKKKKDVEDRTPREIAERYVYRDTDGTCYIPTSYIVGAFIQASSEYKQSNTSRKSMKGIAGGIFRPNTEAATLLCPEKKKPLKDYEVDIRKATNHLKGAVAVCRPRFDRWQTTLTVSVDDTIIDPATAHQILEDAGRRVGVGSFRVSKGGYFGQYEIVEWKELN